jgi:Bacterial Ig domain/Concanavalin A-like lectin/glucanases superfamily
MSRHRATLILLLSSVGICPAAAAMAGSATSFLDRDGRLTRSFASGERVQVDVSASSRVSARMVATRVELVDRDGRPAELYLESTRAYLRVEDHFSGSPENLDTVQATLQADLSGDQESVTLQETGPDTGLFEGSVELRPGPGQPGDQILQTDVAGPPYRFDTVRASVANRFGRADDAVEMIGSLTSFVDATGNEVAAYAAGAAVRLRVEDHNFDDPGRIDKVAVTLRSLTTGDTEELTLLEIAQDSGIFVGTLVTQTNARTILSDRRLQVQEGEDIEAIHVDWNGVLASGAQARIAAETFAVIPADALPVAVNDSATAMFINDPPVADNDAFDFVGNTELRVDTGTAATPHVLETTPTTFGVIDGDSDPVENDPIFVAGIVGCADITAPFNCVLAGVGTVDMESNGRFTFVPEPGDTGANEIFQYTLSDGQATVNATVTLTRFERVWYVKNDSAAGGLGRSADPFDTLVEAQTASLANDYIFVYFGSGAAGGQSAGIALKNGQHLIGEHAGLSLNVNLNGNGAPTNLAAAVAGNRPLINDNNAAAPEGVSATDAVPAEIVGLSLGGANVNAIDWTTTAAFAGGGSFSIRDNVIRTAAAEGVDITLSGTGTVNLAFHDNTLTATGTALDIQKPGTGTLTITAFDDNVVNGNSAASGLVVNGARFDAVPGGGIDVVSGGTTSIGTGGNGVGGAGLILGNVTGSLSFTDLDVFTDGGAALQAVGGASGFTLAVAPAVSTLQATNGPAVNVSNAAITLPIQNIQSTNSPSTGVSLATVIGTFSAGAGSTLTSNTGRAFQVDGSNATVSYAGTITNNGTGIALTNNAGSTISFTGAMTMSTGANAAFTATGGGTVTSTNSTSTLATTTGTALNVANTTIGAANLNFRSISSNGGANAGIVLNNTGASGRLIVTGNGAAGSGGTLQNKATGISLTNTRNPSFSWMQLNDFGDFAIRGSSVIDFTLAHSVINGTNGNDAAADEGSVRFTELTGSATISNCHISGGVENNFTVVNTGGVLNRITFSNTTFGANSTATGDDGLLIEGQSNAVVQATVTGSTFTSARGDHFQLRLLGSAFSDLVFTGNTLSNSHPAVVSGGGGIRLTAGGAGSNVTATYDISGNTLRDSNGTAIEVAKGAGAGSLIGTIDNNQVGVAGVPDSGSANGSGISVLLAETGSHTSTVTNNQIHQTNNFGILLQAGGGVPGSGTLKATVTGNSVSNPGTQAFPKNGFHLNSGTASGDTYQVCLTFGGAGALRNSLTGSGTDGGTDFRLRQRQSTTVRLPGYAGASNDDAAVVSFAQTNNNLGGTPTGAATNTYPTGGGWLSGNCIDDSPVALADAVTVPEDGPATTINVLANDSDPEGDPFAIVSVTQPANGTVLITGGGTGLTYQPNANDCNSVSGVPQTFTYTLTPGGSTTTVTVTVTCVNDAPVAVNDSATVAAGSAVTVSVLANDADVDGPGLSIAAVTQGTNGSAAINPNQTVTYTAGLFVGTDSFTYTVADGAGGTATATVTVTVTPPPRVTTSLQARYDFNEGSGSTVNDTSGVGTPLNLAIANPAAVSWLPGALSVNTSTVLSSAGAAGKVITAVQSSNSVTVEAWIAADNLTQSGPARIVSIERNNTQQRNIVFGQSGNRFETLLRTSVSTSTLQSPVNSVSLSLAHVVYTRSSAGQAVMYINGVQVSSQTASGALSIWDPTFRLTLANASNGSRPWLGDLHLVALYGRDLTSAEVKQNFLAGSAAN